MEYPVLEGLCVSDEFETFCCLNHAVLFLTSVAHKQAQVHKAEMRSLYANLFVLVLCGMFFFLIMSIVIMQKLA